MSNFVYEIVSSLLDGDSIKRVDENGVESWIPVDPANSDYSAYLESLNDDTETE